MKFKTRYRIVTDAFAGYEVQHKFWWSLAWVQTGLTNTHRTVEQAEAWLVDRLERKVEPGVRWREFGRPVKELDV